eukprot:gene26423-biopygen16419
MDKRQGLPATPCYVAPRLSKFEVSTCLAHSEAPRCISGGVEE